MFWGKRQTTIFIFILLLGTLIPSIQMPESTGDLSDPSVLINHNPIYINGDSQFTSGNGVIGGNGTKENPYMIENWSIVLYNFEKGIHIKNTDDYFIIKNCCIYNGASKNSRMFGIYLKNVTNGTMENNRIVSNYYGIYLLKSNINTVSNNICTFSQYAGVYLRYSDSNTIINNTCLKNRNGIILEDSILNVFINNSSQNNEEGICILDSNSNTFINNIFNSNIFDGIFMFDSNLNAITNNICKLNGRNGMHLWYSDINYIINNTCISNGYEGICLRVSCSNNIINNTCNSNYYDGIGIEESNNNTILGNICNSNNDDGIVFYDSNLNIIINNTCNLNNNDGISIDIKGKPSNYNIIINNFCKSNGDNGITCLNGESNTIMSNTCSLNNKKGIYIFGNSNIIKKNICHLNDDGIYLDSSSANILINNICNSNNNGILLFHSSSTILRDNTMVLCGILICGKLLKNWNTHYIDTTNSINSKPVCYWKNQTSGIIPLGAGEVILANCTNVRIIEQNVSNGSVGILLGFTSDSIITNNTCSKNNLEGIRFYSSSGNIVDNCSIFSNSNHDFYFKGNSKNNFAINSTFDTIYFADSNSELIIKNYLHIQVNLINNFPIKGSDILVKDNNKKIFATSTYGGNKPETNDAGQVKWILITDRIYYGKTTAKENVTHVTIGYDDIPILNNNRKINMSNSHFEYFYLNNLLPDRVVLKSPCNNSYINNSTPELKWFVGTERNIYPLTYYVQVDEFGDNWNFLLASNHLRRGVLTWNLTIPLKDGSYQWRVCANDRFGNGSWSEVWSFIIDTTPPSTEIIFPINNEIYNELNNNFSGTSLDLFNGSGVKRVEICIKKLKDDLYWNGTNWTTADFWLPSFKSNFWLFNSSSINWITDNYYNIRSRAIDNVTNREIPGQGIIFMYDNKSPDISININENATYTNITSVILLLNAKDSGSGIKEVTYSNNENDWLAWEGFNHSINFELSDIDGKKYVYYKVIDRANNFAISEDTIILDTTPPFSLSITLNNNTSEINSTNVILNLHALDSLTGVSHMSFSKDRKAWSKWENYSLIKLYTLSSEDGIKTIYFKVKDWAGNIAEPESTSIILNTKIPEVYNPPKEEDKKPSYVIYYYFIFILIIIIILIMIFIMIKRKKHSKQKI
jgi:parallel beta-helix repeat protein